MEVYNWGTFDHKVFRIAPEGNNSLLTGANASGKSTFIDALLTLLVPVKKDRFYNQSSGVDKKGDRTEETYVLGHYGNIQREGENTTSTQALRDKTAYSVILASFSNTDLKQLTLFQIRWFSNGELKRSFGISHSPLVIDKDFNQFDAKGTWKKRLEKTYNANSNKRKIEFFDGPTMYAERISQLLGMRSTKALSLFNQVVGVKVLEDLDEFIRTNMLEEQNAEAEFYQLKESFITLMDAKNNIEKAKEQITQLTPINDIADILYKTQEQYDQLSNFKEVGVYWFASKFIELSTQELKKCEDELIVNNKQLAKLKSKETALKTEETDLMVEIKSDEVGSKIEKLKNEIHLLEQKRDARKEKINEYNKIAKEINLNINPNASLFKTNKDKADIKRIDISKDLLQKNEDLRLSKNKYDDIKSKIENKIETINTLQKNKNNIVGREASIREEILEKTGATKEEIPFIGELIRVKSEEILWEPSIEKVLHSLAYRLIIPEKYYSQVNKYVNNTNLKGRIVYQRYRGHTSLANMINNNPPLNALVSKIEFKTNSLYAEWLEDTIINQYNYICVEDLEEFALYDEKAMTKEGLIKFGKGRHEKDDRPHVLKKENYVLGWDNRDKIKLLQKEIKKMAEDEEFNKREIESIENEIKITEKLKDLFSDINKLFTSFDDIDWQTYNNEIEEKTSLKNTLQKTNNKIKKLEEQLRKVQDALTKLTDVDIKDKNRTIFHLEDIIKQINNNILNNESIIKPLGIINTSEFKNIYTELASITYSNFEQTRTDFQEGLLNKISELKTIKLQKETDVRIKINAFKQPSEEITKKFAGWRSDVSSLPESTHLEFIGEYQIYFKK
jgi:uncharacterized protein YPO0396